MSRHAFSNIPAATENNDDNNNEHDDDATTVSTVLYFISTDSVPDSNSTVIQISWHQRKTQE
jgi:hypothetical protein